MEQRIVRGDRGVRTVHVSPSEDDIPYTPVASLEQQLDRVATHPAQA